MCCSIVGCSISEATAAVALLGDDGAGALAGVEATAVGGTVRVRLAWPGDELGARSSTGDVGGRDD